MTKVAVINSGGLSFCQEVFVIAKTLKSQQGRKLRQL
jgi:hypothetical protein